MTKTAGELLTVAPEDSELFIPTPKELPAWLVASETNSLTAEILSAMRRGEFSVEVTPSSQDVLDGLKTRFESRGWRLCCEKDGIAWQTEERYQLRQTVALFLLECFNRFYGERPHATNLKSTGLVADLILDTDSDFSIGFANGLTLYTHGLAKSSLLQGSSFNMRFGTDSEHLHSELVQWANARLNELGLTVESRSSR